MPESRSDTFGASEPRPEVRSLTESRQDDLVPAGSQINLDTGFPKNASRLNTAGLTITSPTFTTLGATRTLVAVYACYTTNNDPWPTTMAWVGGTPAGATDWTLQVWPATTSGNPSTSFTGDSTSGADAQDTSIHWTTRIYTATATSVLTNVSAVLTRAGPVDANTGILSVYSFENARTTFGAKAQHHTPMSEVNGIDRTVEVPITASASNSWIVGVGQWGNLPDGESFTANGSTTIHYQINDGGAQGAAAAFRLTGLTTASTPYTLGFVDHPGNEYAWSILAIEVLAL